MALNSMTAAWVCEINWASGRERFADEIGEPGPARAARRRLELQLDGVVNVSSDVPTGCVAGMREERSSARDVFFGLDRVQFVLDFVGFAGDRDETNPVKGVGGGAQRREVQTQIIPG